MFSIATLVTVVATLAPYVQDPAPEPAEPCRLSGAFVDEAGHAVSGVKLSVHGFQANSERVRRFGLPQGWQDPAPITTGADGKFTVSFLAPRAFQFTLDASAPGLGRVGWRWSELEPGKELDLGTTTLEPEAILVGHILDARGNLQVEGWTVSAWHNWNSGLGGRSTTSARSVVDPATGQFRIEGLPPGALRVDAGKGSTRIESVNVTTKKGEETFVELRYVGPDPAQRLVIGIGTRPFYPFRPEPGTVHAIAADGTRHALTPAPQRANDWHLVGIAPGTYRVEIRDPRFVDWTNEAVRTGESVSARLVGSAALRIAVVDGSTGAPVEGYSLDVGYRGVNFSPNVFRVRERAEPLPVGGVFAGIVPGDLTLEVQAEGWPLVRAAVDALAPGETRDVTVSLARGVALRGRVVDSAGRPIAGVAVQVTRGEHPGHDRAGAGESMTSGFRDGKSFVLRIGYRDDATTTAEDGSFTFDGLGSGTHALLALRGPWNDTTTTVELPRTEPVVLTLPDAAPLAVRLRLPEGESPAGLVLQLQPAKGQPHDPLRMARTTGADPQWTCGADAVFPARFVPLGAVAFVLERESEDEFGRRHRELVRHEVTLVAGGPAELELDLRESFPVQLSLRTPLPAVSPSEFWSLNLRLTAEGGQDTKRSNTLHRVDGDRRVETRWIAPGVYRIEASAPGLRWSRPEPVQVERGAPNAFDVDVPLVGRELRVLGADGAPLVNTLVAYWTDSELRTFGTTDAGGALKVVLLAGTLSLALPPQPEPTPEPTPGATERSFRPAPRVDPAVLAGLTARATTTFGQGEGPLELRLIRE
jgi:hypothetical protein